jgi:hypothetical protein
MGMARICPAAEPPVVIGKPIAPRVASIQSANATVKFAIESLARQTGLEVDITAIDGSKRFKPTFDKAEFWKVVDGVAEQSGSRVVIGQLGKAVRLVPNTNGAKPIVSVEGPFRISAREIEARQDLISGNATYDLTLEIAWEARLPVFRIDAAPKIEKGEDDAGKSITVTPISTRVAVDGVVTLAKVRLEGIARPSKQIAILKGSYRITAAEEMLRFLFDDLTKLPVAMTQNGVGVNIKRFAKDGTFWTVDIDLSYPPDGPIFESFETFWLSRNRIALVSPTGKKITTDNDEINGSSIRYRFKETDEFKPGNLKDWKLEYETTGAMREVTVTFELRGIPLP